MGNNAYFFISVQVRRTVNKITCLRYSNVQLLKNGDDIGNACEQFYKELYAPCTLLELNIDIFNNVWEPTPLNEELCQSLQRDITRNEITETLSTIKMTRRQEQMVSLLFSSTLCGELWEKIL